ncbi:MAG: hypothetical protein CMF62_09180 [Magnetococcales bacterium]|nr:hypothetical protein [Magnetococcales bacterium]
MRSYYENSIQAFCNDSPEHVLGRLASRHEHKSLEELQRNAWVKQILILQSELKNLQGSIYFEFSIPRMGKRADNILIVDGRVFVIEFKVGEYSYKSHDIEQATDYALDLKNFHSGSHNCIIFPILVATEANETRFNSQLSEDGVCAPTLTNSEKLEDAIQFCLDLPSKYAPTRPDWGEAGYKPTPTIIEASQALYEGYDVKEISRSDAGAINLQATSDRIIEIIKDAKKNHKKAICFVTGVPGAGKTLAGLNIVNQVKKINISKHAVFLSGNAPLVTVLRKALTESELRTSKIRGEKVKKSVAERRVHPFIQNIHHYRSEYILPEAVPNEQIAIFDEAQRAWDMQQTNKFMKNKKNIENFNKTEPKFLMEVMNRHKDWCVVVCLIGGGQEIHTGEVGIKGWLKALSDDTFANWEIHCSEAIKNKEYSPHQDLEEILKSLSPSNDKCLHLKSSLRSFRAENLSKFVHYLLDFNLLKANTEYAKLNEYPLVVTRDLSKAKQWLKERARGSERYGIIASAGGLRLKPEGIFVKSPTDVGHWFLSAKNDVRSSFALEEVATEFDVQGLELDWACLAWDADLRVKDSRLVHKNFNGTKWKNVNKNEAQNYFENKYRVLLTRARQGLIIFIPSGDPNDETRLPEFYDGIYRHLKNCGIKEI